MYYFLQQLINGLSLGCIYALIAMGYTMVHGIIGQINLAHGEIHMLGAFMAFTAIVILGILGIDSIPVVIVIAFLVAATLTAVPGWATYRIVFRPLQAAPGYAPLIATIGLSIILQEFVRLARGADNLWLYPLFSGSVVIGRPDGFTAVLLYRHLFIVGLTTTVFLLCWLLVTRTALGRAQRACAQDLEMAALSGVDVERTIGLTFAVAAALAAVAGLVVVTHYGVIGFFMGFIIGIKCLTAAIVGGIGSLPGAVIGGLIVGLVETFWSAYFGGEYRDVVVFTLLVLALVFRPSGILGRPVIEHLPGPGQARH